MKKILIQIAMSILAVNAFIFLGTYAIDRPFIYNFFLNLAIPSVGALACWRAERSGKAGMQ